MINYAFLHYKHGSVQSTILIPLMICYISCEFLWSKLCGVQCSICNSCIMDTSDLLAQNQRATGPRAEGIHIRQITCAHVTTNM